MARVLAAFVHVVDEDGNTAVLAPGTTVPAWAKAQVTNPAAFVAGGEQEPDADEAPTTEKPDEVPETEPEPVEVLEVAPEPVEVLETPAPEKPIEDMSFGELQAAAKSRGLSGAGTKNALVASLEADDREKAADTAAAEKKE